MGHFPCNGKSMVNNQRVNVDSKTIVNATVLEIFFGGYDSIVLQQFGDLNSNNLHSSNIEYFLWNISEKHG